MGMGSQGRCWFVKGDVIVVVDVVYKQMDFIVRMNFFFILMVFCIDIWCVIVEKIDVFCWNINVIEKVMMYKVVVVFWVFFWQVNIFVYIKGDYMFKVDFVCFVYFNQCFVCCQWCVVGRQFKDKWMIGGWFECINMVNDMVSGLFVNLFCGIQGDQFYFLF